MTTQKIIVIHHRDSDGYCAALAAYCYGNLLVQGDGSFERAEMSYIDVQYDEPFPDVVLDKNTTVYILDFSYDRKILDDVYAKVKTLKVIDHHKTAKAQLEGAPYAIYDMTKSGSTLAWEFFFGSTPTSALHQLVEDYDINWPQKYPESRWLENSLLVNPRCKDLAYWKKLMEDPTELQENIQNGKGIAYGNDRLIAQIVENKSYQEVQYGGYRGLIMNSTVLRNEIAAGLLAARPDIEFVATYRIMSIGRMRVAFRSRKQDEHVDISVLASHLGGGGHRYAATAVVSLKTGFDLLRDWHSR